jgi:glycosyltransferase involved in cell wall biosynthesis
MSRISNICVVIPALNEEESIGFVIQKIKTSLPVADIVVVNDGSSDKTSLVGLQHGITVLDLPFNLGIGGAVQTGLKYAYGQGYDIVVEIDADGQHDPIYASFLVNELKSSSMDLVIGSRFISDPRSTWPVIRLFGIRLFSLLIKLVSGHKIYDSTSGYRVYSKSALKFLSTNYPADFPEPESIVLLLNNGFSVCERPVRMGARISGQSIIGRSDISLKGAYFVVSNAIAIIISGLKEKRIYDHAG